MATLKQLLSEFEGKLIKVRNDRLGVQEQFNNQIGEAVVMYSGEVYDEDSDNDWEMDWGDIENYKKDTFDAIDAKTDQIITSGVDYDGHTFSTSIPAQLNWASMEALYATGKLQFSEESPVPISCKGASHEYLLTSEAQFDGLILTMVGHKMYNLAVGRNLKATIEAMETVPQVLAFTDPR